MKNYITKVTSDDIANGIKDEFGVIYSPDGKRLLKSARSDLKYYMVHENTEVICDDAFYEKLAIGCCPNPGVYLREIRLPESVKAIGNNVFKGSLLSLINLPEGLNQIGNYAFFNTCLKFIILPSSLLSIGDYAFGWLWQLQEVKIPASVIEIGKAPFVNCEILKNIIVDERNTHFIMHNGMLCDIEKTRLIQCPNFTKEETDVPESLIRCDNGAFWRDTCIDNIPVTIRNRWKLQRMKDIMLTLIDRANGTKHFIFPELHTIDSIKLSADLYCNILTTIVNGEQTYLIDKKNNLMTFLYALGFTKLEIEKKLSMIKTIKAVRICKRNYKRYLNRTLAEPVFYDWNEDFVYEDTGEVVTIPRHEVILDKGTVLDEENISLLLKYIGSGSSSPFIRLYNENRNMDSFSYFYIRDADELTRNEAIHELDGYIPHVALLSYIEHKNQLLKAIIHIFQLHQPEDDDELAANQDYLSEDTQWCHLIEEFFNRETEKTISKEITPSVIWNKMERFLVSRNYGYLANQFKVEFSFLFRSYQDRFNNGPFIYG